MSHDLTFPEASRATFTQSSNTGRWGSRSTPLLHNGLPWPQRTPQPCLAAVGREMAHRDGLGGEAMVLRIAVTDVALGEQSCFFAGISTSASARFWAEDVAHETEAMLLLCFQIQLRSRIFDAHSRYYNLLAFLRPEDSSVTLCMRHLFRALRTENRQWSETTNETAPTHSLGVSENSRTVKQLYSLHMCHFFMHF